MVAFKLCLFGLQEWYEIVKQFEAGNVHLAECAQRLTRMVNYEVPALKQQIARCKQVQRVRPSVCVCVGGRVEVWVLLYNFPLCFLVQQQYFAPYLVVGNPL